MNAFFLEKCHPPPPAVLHENFMASWRSLLFEYFDRTRFLKKSSQVFENFNRCYASRQNLFSNFVDFICLAHLPGWYCNPQLLQPLFFYEFLGEPLARLSQQFYCEKLSANCIREKILNNATRIHFWSQPSWKLRLQPIVASNFGGNPFVDGILGHNLLLSRPLLVGIPSWMGF
jgi:hypothetical protein